MLVQWNLRVLPHHHQGAGEIEGRRWERQTVEREREREQDQERDTVRDRERKREIVRER